VGAYYLSIHDVLPDFKYLFLNGSIVVSAEFDSRREKDGETRFILRKAILQAGPVKYIPAPTPLPSPRKQQGALSQAALEPLRWAVRAPEAEETAPELTPAAHLGASTLAAQVTARPE
jgi:hypothetical protein